MALRIGRAHRAALVLAPAGAALLALTGCGGGSAGPAKVAGPAATGTSATATASPSPTASTTATATATAVAADCDYSGLSAHLAQQNAATGHDRLLVQLTNGSQQPCSLNGYPVVALVGADGSATEVTNNHNGDFTFPDEPAKPVRLGPGEVASFDVGIKEIPGESEDCTDAPAIAVTPPGGQTALKVSVAVTVCGGQVSVSPVMAGPDGVGS